MGSVQRFNRADVGWIRMGGKDGVSATRDRRSTGRSIAGHAGNLA
jgi:hypothetical protein